MSSADLPADDPGNRGGPVDHHETERAAVDDPAKRQIMKRLAAGAGGAAVATVGGSQVPGIRPVGRAQAIAPLGAVVIGAHLVGAAGVAGYTAGYFAKGDNTDEILEAQANERHDSVHADAVDMQLGSLYTLDNLENSTMMLRAFVRTNAAYAVVNEIYGNDGDEQTVKNDGIAVAESTIADSVAKLEHNHMRMWRRQILRAARLMDSVMTEPELTVSDVFRFYTGGNWTTEDGTGGGLPLYDDYSIPADSDDSTLESENEDVVGTLEGTNMNYVDYPLINGDVANAIPFVQRGNIDTEMGASICPWSDYNKDAQHFEENANVGSSQSTLLNSWSNPDVFDSGNEDSPALSTGLGVVPREDGEHAMMIDSFEWSKAHNDLIQVYNDELAYAETIVNQLYEPIQAGEVEPGDISSADAILEAGEGFEDWNRAAAVYRGMFMHESEPAEIEMADGTKLEGKLFWTHDDAADGFEIGTEQVIDQLPGSLNVASEIAAVPDDADESAVGEILLGEVTENFTVTGLLSGSGSTLEFEMQNITEPDQQTEDELLQQLLNAYEKEQESQKTTVEVIREDGDGWEWTGLPFGDGGNWLPDPPLIVIGLLAAGYVYFSGDD